VELRRRARRILARRQIAVGALARRAGLDVGMVEGPSVHPGADTRTDFDDVLEQGRRGPSNTRSTLPSTRSCPISCARAAISCMARPSELDEVRPMRATDHEGRTLEAVFPTSDGIWPRCSFATLDRGHAGALWAGCYRVRRGPLSIATTSFSPKRIRATTRCGGPAPCTCSRESRSRRPGYRKRGWRGSPCGRSPGDRRVAV
jgi:hypothetical protein